jgi:hypothetical protein
MCMNCGCGRPNDDRGEAANITLADLEAAATANDQGLRESAQHILDAVALLDASPRDSSALAEPAGSQGGRDGGRGTPASES